MTELTRNRIYIAAGWVMVALGFIGLFLPIFPTTPFILVAAFFFSRGSEKWHHWLLNHRHFGPPLTDWENDRIIRPKSKWVAAITISGSIAFIHLFVPIVAWGKWSATAVMLGVIVYISVQKSS